MAYVTNRFQNIIKKHGGFHKKASTSRTATKNNLCHKCRKHGHFLRDCSTKKNLTRKARYHKKELVLDNI